jgi:hypothetical protein
MANKIDQIGGLSLTSIVHNQSYIVELPAGPWAVFQGASEAPYLSIRVESRRLPDRLRIDSEMRPPRALPTAHFNRNAITIQGETVHEPLLARHGVFAEPQDSSLDQPGIAGS